jgi:hypothetical protein
MRASKTKLPPPVRYPQERVFSYTFVNGNDRDGIPERPRVGYTCTAVSPSTGRRKNMNDAKIEPDVLQYSNYRTYLSDYYEFK